jgi:hypothetical protein
MRGWDQSERFDAAWAPEFIPSLLNRSDDAGLRGVG